jgi:prevent-host-death family protein
MAAYSLTEAKQQLDRLVEEAMSGELVTITREGQAVVTLTPSAPSRSPIDAAYLDWMRKRREERPSLGGDAVSLVREMRDEER